MKRLSAVALIMAFLAVPMAATPADEIPGQQSQIVASVPIGGYSCGRQSYPTNCYGIPANVGGTFWLDAYTNAYPSPTGFIAFFGVADLDQATITNATTVKNSLGQVTQLAVVFKGNTNDGDGGTYSGSAVFTFSYYKMSGGGGRGNGYPGYVQILTNGSLTITYN
jgi:hypothetical protein